MGLNDAHTVYGCLLGALFHSMGHGKAKGPLVTQVPRSLQKLLSVRFPRWQSSVSLRRWALAGAILANLPGWRPFRTAPPRRVSHSPLQTLTSWLPWH